MVDNVLQAPVRLVSGVRSTLNEQNPPGADLDLEDRQAVSAAIEAELAAMEQAQRGNTGSVRSVVPFTAPEVEIDLENAPEARRMDEAELNGIIERELSEALGANSDELQGMRSKALDYYAGRPRGDEKKGRSKLQSLDVADMVESQLAQILPAITRDLSVEFEALSTDPQALAQLEEESKTVNHIVQKENKGFLLLMSLLKDALLLKNCVAKVYLDDSYVAEITEHQGIDPLQLAILMQQKRQAGARVLVDQVDPDTQTVTLKTVQRQRKIKICAVPPDEIRLNGDHDSVCLNEARFVCHDRIMREKELTAMGYPEDVVKDLPTYSTRADTTHISRSQVSKEHEIDTSDIGNRPIRIYECWMLVDYDGDGIVERRKVMRSSNNVILENTVMGYMGIMSGAMYVNPHKWAGISSYDKLKNIQDFKTHMLRQAADNASTANNARLGYVKGQVNEDHLFNSRPGGGVAMKRPDAIVPINVPNVIPAIFDMLGYGDKMRTERSGASLDMQSQQIPLQNRTAHGAERVISAMELITSMINETFVQTVLSDIYVAVHYLLREYFPAGYVFSTGTDVMASMPGAWPKRDSVTLGLGPSIGERIKIMGSLQGVMAQQLELLNAGRDELVSVSNIYKARVDYARAAGLPNPSQYWTDPMSQEGQAAMQAKQEQAQRMQQMQVQQQQEVINLQRQVIEAQEQTKRLIASWKKEVDQDKISEQRRQHGVDTANDLTEMELKYQQDVPGSAV